MRDLSVDVDAELDEAVVRPAILMKAEFRGGDLCLWTGLGPLIYAGDTYQGSGDLLGFSPIRESQEFAANGLSIQLSALPQQYLALALTEAPVSRGRPLTLFLALLNPTGGIVGDPIPFRYRLDTMEIEESADSAVVTVQAESRAAILKRAKERRWTHEEQQSDYPGDLGFEYVEYLQNADVPWRARIKGA